MDYRGKKGFLEKAGKNSNPWGDGTSETGGEGGNCQENQKKIGERQVWGDCGRVTVERMKSRSAMFSGTTS